MSTLVRRVLSATLLLALVVVSAAAAAGGARKDSGTAWLSANHMEGGLVVVSGDIKSKVLGRGALVYRVKATGDANGSIKVTSNSVTVYTPAGSLSGTGFATQTTDAAGNTMVTDGHITLNKGTGKLKGHSLTATFSGPLKDNVYTFTYQGTYR